MRLDFLYQPFLGTTVLAYLQFAAILLLGWLFARMISKYFAKLIFILFKKRFDTNGHSQEFVTLLLQPLQGLVITVVSFIAFNRIAQVLEQVVLFNRKVKSAVQGQVTTFSLMTLIDHIFFLFILFYFCLLLSRILDFIFYVLKGKAIQNDDRQRQQLLPLLKDVLKALVWSMGFFAILGVVFHVNVPTLIAGMGVGGVAIAFAAKETLENLLASFMVMLDKPFTIGDWIKVDGVEGTVESVGFRSTRIRSFDKSIISLPNRALIDGQLENFSERGMRRVNFTVGAVYGLSQQALETIIAAIKKLIEGTAGTTGTAISFLDGFGDSSVNIRVVYFVTLENSEIKFETVKQTINFGIYQIMYKYGKGFAFPTQTAIQGEDVDEVEKDI